jgi:hypothetical protein
MQLGKVELKYKELTTDNNQEAFSHTLSHTHLLLFQVICQYCIFLIFLTKLTIYNSINLTEREREREKVSNCHILHFTQDLERAHRANKQHQSLRRRRR